MMRARRLWRSKQRCPRLCLRSGLAVPTMSRVPCVVRRDETKRWIVVRASGALTLSEILDVIHTARATVQHQMWPMIVDARSATTEISENDIERAVDAVREASARGPRGHVSLVADDDTLYARMLLYEARCADIGIRVIRAFRQLPDAERWLEIVSAARHFG